MHRTHAKPLSSRYRLLLGFIFYGCFLLAFQYRAPQEYVSPLFFYLLALAPALMVGPVLSRILTPLTPWSRRMLQGEIVATVFALASLCLSPGVWAGLIALPWTLMTLWIAGIGGLRLLRMGIDPPEEFILHLGLVFLAVGGIWWEISRLGLNPMAFGHAIVFLTGAHFHYAGFASCVILGLSGRLFMRHAHSLPKKLYLISLISSVLGIPLLALGISFSPLLEMLSAFVFALGLLLWSGLMLSQLKQIQRLGARLLLGGACLSILWSMFWALNYALSNYLGQSWVSIPQMGWRHGLFNVLGYALPALLALCWEHPPARQLIRPIPFSQLFARQHVGAEFFAQKSPKTPLSKRPTGLIEDFSRYARADFNDEALPTKLRHFYEHSEDYGLRVIPEWQWGFQRAGRLFRKVMDKIGQMALPIEAERLDEAIESKILPVDDTLDGRQGVRAWVRTYQDSGHVVYAAAYSQHQQGEHCYMNIAFPLPWSQMSSILRLDLLKTQASRPALKLSSLPQQGHYGDQGVYWVFPWFTLRLPINETIEVWTCSQARDWPHEIPAGSQLLAQHDMWICGLHCLRLYYSIFPEKPTELENELSA